MSSSGQTSGLSAILLFVLSLAALFIAAPHTAQAADPGPTRTLGVAAHDGKLLLTCDYRDVFSRQVQAKLTSGLPTRLVFQLELQSKSGKAVAGWARSAEIVYDLWEEVYQVTVEDERGRRRATLRSAAEAMAAAGRLVRDRVATVSGLPSGDYRLHIVVEINPVSRRMVENIRRWLARPPAGKSSDPSQGNFFGSFVGTFVDRRIGEADHSVEFVSQWFHLGQP